MPVVGSSRANYCSVSDLIAFGVPEAKASDAACDLASRVVEDFCGRSFGGSAPTYIDRYDVRTELVPIPSEMTAVTAVTINGGIVDPSAYQVDFDASVIRLYWAGMRDADGFRRNVASFRANRGPYGAHIQVAGMVGYTTVPAPVSEAAKRLAARYAMTTQGDQLPPPGVARIVTEGYQLQIDKSELGVYATTGDIEVDRLLAPYRDVRGLVG